MRHFLLLFGLALAASCSSAPKSEQPTPSPAADPNPASTAPTDPKVRQYVDRKSGGWAYKIDDQAFEIERSNGCLIKWNVITTHAKPNQLDIEVRDTCRFDHGLSRSLPFYGQILDAILAKYSKDKIRIFYSSSWYAIKAWDQELAVAAIESGLWKSYLKKRKDRPHTPSNRVFVEVFNQGNVARKLSEVFETRGLTLKLRSVEKVFEKRFKNLPFAHEYAAYSTSSTHVPYSAGTFIFDVKLVGTAEP